MERDAPGKPPVESPKIDKLKVACKASRACGGAEHFLR